MDSTKANRGPPHAGGRVHGDRLRTNGRGSYEAALKETQTKFDIGSGATVAKALKVVVTT
jgi:hypothetical protein